MIVDVWQTEQVQRCGDCGTFEWEWDEDAEAWEADIHWCLGCFYREQKIDEAKKATDPRGYKIRLWKGRGSHAG